MKTAKLITPAISPNDEIDYAEIGAKAGLNGRKRTMYVLYMSKRWALKQIGRCYAEEWADRFKYDTAYLCSDSNGQQLLDMLNLIVK